MITHTLYGFNSEAILNLTAGFDSGFDITVQNPNSFPIYLGGDGPLDEYNYGYRLEPGAAFSIELSGQDDLFAYTTESSATLAVLQAHLETGK